MKHIAALAALLALAGCWKGLSYEEVQAGYRYCKANGLASELLQAERFDGQTVAIKVACADNNGTQYDVPSEEN